MNVIFLFLDESCDHFLDVASLTGVFVPADKYAGVRDEMLRLSVVAQSGKTNHTPRPLELHGVDMLRDVEGASDSDRFAVFDAVVDIVQQQQLEVLSVGYSGVRDIHKGVTAMGMPEDQKLYHLNLERLLGQIQLSDDTLLMPVFDGVPGRGRGSPAPVDVDARKTFLDGIHYSHHYRVATGHDELYMQNFRNIGETTFSDSAKHPLLQLADIIGYLLASAEAAEHRPVTPFKQRLVRIAERLPVAQIRRVRATMTFGHQ